jgi:hypothetical protein
LELRSLTIHRPRASFDAAIGFLSLSPTGDDPGKSSKRFWWFSSWQYRTRPLAKFLLR